MAQCGRENTIDIPKPCGPVVRRSEKTIAVGAELDVLDDAGVPADHGEQRAAFHIPDAGHSVHGRGGEETVVRTERAIYVLVSRIHGDVGGLQATFLPEHASQLAGDTVPKPGRALYGDGGGKAAVVTERAAMRLALVTAKNSDLSTARQIPKSREVRRCSVDTIKARFPSGLKAIPRGQPGWCIRKIDLPSSVLHIWQVCSNPWQAAKVRPSGLKAADSVMWLATVATFSPVCESQTIGLLEFDAVSRRVPSALNVAT